MKEAIVRSIHSARRVMVITHVSPDGDAIGSLLGLGWALRWLRKEYVLVCADPVPKSYTYLPGSEAIVIGPDDDGYSGLLEDLDRCRIIHGWDDHQRAGTIPGLCEVQGGQTIPVHRISRYKRSRHAHRSFERDL